MNSKSKNQTDASKAVSRKELEDWINGYRVAVGDAADSCPGLLQTLIEHGFLKPASRGQLLELWRILNGLSADPVTISCATLHVAQQAGHELNEHRR